MTIGEIIVGVVFIFLRIITFLLLALYVIFCCGYKLWLERGVIKDYFFNYEVSK